MNRKMLDILACPMCKHHPLESIELELLRVLVRKDNLFLAYKKTLIYNLSWKCGSSSVVERNVANV